MFFWDEIKGEEEKQVYFSYNELEKPIRHPNGYAEKVLGHLSLEISSFTHMLESLFMNRYHENPWHWLKITKQEVKNEKRSYLKA